MQRRLAVLVAFLTGFAAGQRQPPPQNVGQSEELLRTLDLTNELESVQIYGLLVKGVNASLPVSATRQFAYPRVLRGNSYRVDSEDGQYRVTEIKTTRTYSQTETGMANARGEDVEAALARIVQRLEAAGYRPL